MKIWLLFLGTDGKELSDSNLIPSPEFAPSIGDEVSVASKLEHKKRIDGKVIKVTKIYECLDPKEKDKDDENNWLLSIDVIINVN
jgi:hypothetical protein